MSEVRSVADLWAEVKLTVEGLERDVTRNVDKHNVSAGVRVRKGVRKLRALGAELIRSTTNLDKSLTATRRAEKVAKKPAGEKAAKPAKAAKKPAA